ncbi:MAG: PAS domain S-box protein, partial [Alphaproteobacteria bacterium]|nr:PAS domain S-box protein [Alphaproteobacteria bacterium]
VITIDAQGIVQSFSASAERIFGYAAAEVLGGSVNRLMPAAEARRHDGYLAFYRETGEARIIGVGREVVGRRKDGSEFPLDLAVGEVRSGLDHHFVGTIRDLSERKEREAQLRQSQRMEALGQLTGGIAHDFNNLLAVIRINLDLVRDLVAGQDDAEPLIANARKAAASSAELTERLTAFSRRQALNPLPIDLNLLVDGMDGLLRRSLGETIAVETVLAPDLWATLVDPVQLETVLLNLAINARDAMTEGGRLLIETANSDFQPLEAGWDAEIEPGDYVMLAVSDNGTGMAPEVRQRSIEPFFTTKDVGQGTGLGLSMVYGFVRQSGGQIWLNSEEGRGTTIKIYLPRTQQVAEQPGRTEPLQVAGGNEVVLVIEDQFELRQAVVAVLEGLGYRVLPAADGRAALEILEGTPDLDLLFSDVVLPRGLSGAQVAARVRRSHPRARVLFTSGYTRNALDGDGELVGIELLTKPFGKKDLAARVRAVLDRS